MSDPARPPVGGAGALASVDAASGALTGELLPGDMLPPRPLEGIFGDFFVVQAAEDWGHRPDHVLDSQWWPLRGQRGA